MHIMTTSIESNSVINNLLIEYIDNLRVDWVLPLLIIEQVSIIVRFFENWDGSFINHAPSVLKKWYALFFNLLFSGFFFFVSWLSNIFVLKITLEYRYHYLLSYQINGSMSHFGSFSKIINWTCIAINFELLQNNKNLLIYRHLKVVRFIIKDWLVFQCVH